MSFEFGSRSLGCLEGCAPPLVRVMVRALSLGVMDFSVLEGHRGEEAQNRAVEAGRSTLLWPAGKHNRLPSEAVDVAPHPINWKDRERFVLLAGVILAAAALEGVAIRWGGDWDSDGFMTDESFRDLGHFELAT